jgi:hypothetical protein
LSRVALMQTVMGKGHGKRWFQNVRNISKFASCLVFLTRTFRSGWHMFAAMECSDGKKKLPTSYRYLASTRSASGRPTRDLIQRILDDL